MLTVNATMLAMSPKAKSAEKKNKRLFVSGSLATS
jgi:hypothetical protein